MADTKISGLTALIGANTASGDLLTIVDVSDTTMAASGTNKKITLTELQSAPVSAGTANGVAYLNGSKVVTTGSALVFDGTNLGVGTASPVSIGGYGIITPNGASGGAVYFQQGGVTRGRLITTGNELTLGTTVATNPLVFELNNTEAMRLTSTGLGIGTSSPAAKLDVRGSTYIQSNSVYALTLNPGIDTVNTKFGITFTTPTYQGGIAAIRAERVGATDAGQLLFYTSPNGDVPNLRATLDSSGNLGLGVTPSAWGASAKVLELTNGTFLLNYSNSSQAIVGANAYYTGSNWLYKNTAAASNYEQNAGAHKWFYAASGTAGNAITFTQAMTLDASGNLGIGLTSPSNRIHVQTATTGSVDAIRWTDGATDTGYLGIVSGGGARLWAGGFLAFGAGGGASYTERARIDSSGNLLVGTTSALISADYRLSISGTRGGEFKSTGGATAPTNTIWNNATTGDNVFESFRTETSDTQRGTISYNRGAGLVAYNTTSDYRAKDILGPVVDSGALIDSVPVYMGKMKGATQERPMFIAHETPAYAHTGAKDAVDENGNPVYQQMDASSLVPVMWAEIQSLRARVAALES